VQPLSSAAGWCAGKDSALIRQLANRGEASANFGGKVELEEQRKRRNFTNYNADTVKFTQ